MSAPYITAIAGHFPHADIIYDKFHISQHLGNAVDKARDFRNFKNYRTRILFYCGKLSPAPQDSTKNLDFATIKQFIFNMISTLLQTTGIWNLIRSKISFQTCE